MIIKPDRGSQGRGIHLIQDFEDFDSDSNSAVAQAYLVPYVMNGKKFDLRIYVLVTSCDPLRAYIFRDGMVRFCTENYEQPRAKNLDNDYAHLTNFSLNKKNKLFAISENKRSLSVVFAELAELGIDVEKVREEIHRIVRLTLIAGQPVIASSYHTGICTHDGKSRCFEILGFDILLDSSAKPWLLEVNCMPSLAASSEFDSHLKTRVLDGVLKIIDLDGSFKTKVVRRFKEIRTQKSPPVTVVFDPERESEIAKATEWLQLLPATGHSDIADICEKALAAVRDFGPPRRVPPADVQAQAQAPEAEAEPRRPPRRRSVDAAAKPKITKPPTVSVPRAKVVPKQAVPQNRVTRGVVLANEARTVRLNAFAMRGPSVGKSVEIFRVFPPAGNSLAILVHEERDRIAAAGKQAQAAFNLGLARRIRALFTDGTVPVYRAKSPKGGPGRGIIGGSINECVDEPVAVKALKVLVIR
jgi:tubulin polyglutamylase TTLL6/13